MQPLPLSNSRKLLSPQMKPCTISRSQPRAPCPQPLAATDLFSIVMGLPTLKISYKWNHTTRGLLRLASFPWCDVLRIHPCCGMCQHFVLFHSRIIFHYEQTPFYLFLCCWTSGCFHFQAIINTAPNKRLWASFCGETCVYSSWVYT